MEAKVLLYLYLKANIQAQRNRKGWWSNIHGVGLPWTLHDFTIRYGCFPQKRHQTTLWNIIKHDRNGTRPGVPLWLGPASFSSSNSARNWSCNETCHSLSWLFSWLRVLKSTPFYRETKIPTWDLGFQPSRNRKRDVLRCAQLEKQTVAASCQYIYIYITKHVNANECHDCEPLSIHVSNRRLKGGRFRERWVNYQLNLSWIGRPGLLEFWTTVKIIG